MKKKNFLKFSEDGTRFQVIFHDGTASLPFDDKITGTEAIIKFVDQGMVSEKELSGMVRQIFAANKLSSIKNESPDSNDEIEVSIIGMPPFGFPGLTRGMGLMSMIGSVLMVNMNTVNNSNSLVKKPHFKLCKCGKHGWIITESIMSPDISNQGRGFEVVEEMERKEMITAEESVVIRDEIKNSGLPLTSE